MYFKFYFSYMKIPLYKILMYNSLTNQFKKLLKIPLLHFELLSIPFYISDISLSSPSIINISRNTSDKPSETII